MDINRLLCSLLDEVGVEYVELYGIEFQVVENDDEHIRFIINEDDWNSMIEQLDEREISLSYISSSIKNTDLVYVYMKAKGLKLTDNEGVAVLLL